MPLMAPDSSERIAVSRNGMRNQVGRSVASAPTGSLPMFSESSAEEPARVSPKVIRTTGPSDPPRVFQKMIELPLASRD